MTVPKRFGVLRFFGTLLKVIAWIVLVLSVLSAIGAALAGGTLVGFIPGADDNPTLASALQTGSGILIGLTVLILGLIYFLILYVTGESLHLNLAVEENTRLTAALLLRMHQEGQGDAAAPYGAGGGFVNEPYDN
jgi:uncharacterized membrane protein